VTEIGIFVVPGAEDLEATVAEAIAADDAGLDYVAVQDHPYQRRYLDTAEGALYDDRGASKVARGRTTPLRSCAR
jgi:hypothetical protein